jgi:hypothetical protein
MVKFLIGNYPHQTCKKAVDNNGEGNEGRKFCTKW